MSNNDMSQQIKNAFLNATYINRLIYINIAVFVVVKLISLVTILFNIPPANVINVLQLPSNLHQLLYMPWTIITHMFLHLGFSHLFFNLISLYFIARIASEIYSQKQLIALYLLGGIAGGALFVLAYNIFPYFKPLVYVSYLHGASGAVFAILIAIATARPNYPLRFPFININFKLIHIAAFAFVISILGITDNNAGGQFAHIGGALMGFFFAKAVIQGNDPSKPVTRIINFFHNLTKPKNKQKTKTFNYQRSKTDAQYNQQRHNDNVVLDQILDKIKKNGYQSLTPQEKQQLFDQSKRKN